MTQPFRSSASRRVLHAPAITITASGMRINPQLPHADDIRLALALHQQQQQQRSNRQGSQLLEQLNAVLSRSH